MRELVWEGGVQVIRKQGPGQSWTGGHMLGDGAKWGWPDPLCSPHCSLMSYEPWGGGQFCLDSSLE